MDVLLFIVLVFIYFLPTVIAWYRGAGKTVQIFIINLFFGWTVIAWIICLSWCFSGKSTIKVE